MTQSTYCEIQNNCKLLIQMQNQYNAVVEQNKSLQTELNEIKREALKDPINLREFFLMNCAAAEYDNDTRKKIVEFLTEWSSQDNRGTRFPYYYTIADENQNFEADDRGEFFFDYHNGTYSKIEDILREEFEKGNIEINEDDDFEEIISEIGDSWEDDRINDWLRNYNQNSLQRFSIDYQTYYEGIFFTEKDADEYLERTRHHRFGPNPRTYVDCFDKWGRNTKTEEFLNLLFEYFGVKVPPGLYYDKKKEAEKAKEGEIQQ